MLKAPWWRVAGWELVDANIRERARVQIERIIALFPFADQIKEPQIVGSYARMRAMLHSDLDVHLELVKEHQNDFVSLRDRPQLAQQIVDLREEISATLGIHVDLSIRPFSEVTAGKQVFGLRSQQWFNKLPGEVRLDHIYYDGLTGVRDIRRRKIGNFAFDDDPWFAAARTWARRYGDAYQQFGFTEDSAWAR